MNTENWQKIKDIFSEVIELPEDERAAFLNKCDVEFRYDVETLMNANKEAGDFINEPALVDIGLAAENQIDTYIGERIDSYKILEEIGHGGMGTVYLASRADESFDKQVALKLIKRGMDSDAIIKRFVMERQILANLDHPNIARLIDGGTTVDGLPYFVLEYIEGTAITRYCDQHRLNTIERLKLFRQVCAAVQFAHQNLIVHRDLKPSNIIVTEDGTPKLLDFGIAKLLSADWSTSVEATATIGRVLTPEYASPEELHGLPVTTSSDVYSLGVVLYELLSGHRPFNFESRSPEDAARLITASEPIKPSVVITRIEVARHSDDAEHVSLTPEAISRTRDGNIEKLRRRLAGDLDNILLKALRKEPERRYASVQEFSEDLRRHLEGLPVLARPDTLSYRTSKFITRHKAGVAAAVIVLLTLLSATVITGWQARVARRERDKSESRFNQVRKLANTVLFDYHERIKNLPGATEARKKMVTDALEYLDNLSKDSDNSPELQRELALAYQKVGDIQGGNSEGGNTGETEMALENYRKALAIQEKLISQTQATNADRRTLAGLYINVGFQLGQKGDFQSQEALCRRALIALSEIVPNDVTSTATARSDLARVLFYLASALQREGNLDGAFEEYRKATEIYETLAVEQPDKRDDYLRSAALTYKAMGAIRELKEPLFALELYRKALAIDSENASANPNNVQYQLDYSFSYNSVASVLSDGGNLKEALEHCQKALAIQEKVVADDAKNSFARFSLARTYRRLGNILEKLKRFDEASTNYQNSIRKFEEHSKANPDSVGIKARLGEINSIFGNFLFTWANKPESYSRKVQRLREAQTFQKRGLEIFLALKSQNALDKPYEEILIAVQKSLQQTETELARSSIR